MCQIQSEKFCRILGLVAGLFFVVTAFAQEEPTVLMQDDFTHGTYIIDQPGVYVLGENISFNPNSRDELQALWASGELNLPNQVDAYGSSMPLFNQFLFGPGSSFSPGGPDDARYDPAAYGIGFFAAIAIATDDVELDLNGFTIEQSAEHALMQRFFAVIELADQPFIPSQGPADFGSRLSAAHRVKIHNGTIGRSAHHGIHGNANSDVEISDVRFVDYEVAAVALNGADRVEIRNVVARNRKDVPVLGTFSSAMFIKSYVDDLVRAGSATTLTVNGTLLTAADIQQDLREVINNVHGDIVVRKHTAGDRVAIDEQTHPVEFGLFHNKHGVIDGNSYSFLTNHVGIAVHGFPTRPDGVTRIASKNISFENVRVMDQQSFINETPALNVENKPAIDPVGAVFQVKNLHPSTGEPITVSSKDPALATYIGNPVANAQAFVAKAALNGDVGSGRLDTSRLNISRDIIDWVEGVARSRTLEQIDATWLCNGDSMFHVNKGAIGFKIDSVQNVSMVNTRVSGISNLGEQGSTLCGDYSSGVSHPLATLPGYGGAFVRGYTFAGSTNVTVDNARVSKVRAKSGTAVGFAVMTDSDDVLIQNSRVSNLKAGRGITGAVVAPNTDADAVGFHISSSATSVAIDITCVRKLHAHGSRVATQDESGAASIENQTESRRCAPRGSAAGAETHNASASGSRPGSRPASGRRPPRRR